MRWELLFEDLEAFADAADRAVFEAEVVDRARGERAGLGLHDRLCGHLGTVVRLRLVTGERLTGVLTDVGADWVLVADGAVSVLVALPAVTGVEGLGRRALVDDAGLARRVRLPVVLRRLARDRSGVRLRLTDGGELVGTIDRAATDHLDLALHPVDEPRRRGAVRGVCIVPVRSVVYVRAQA